MLAFAPKIYYQRITLKHTAFSVNAKHNIKLNNFSMMLLKEVNIVRAAKFDVT